MVDDRLRDNSEIPFERELLRAAAEESPPPSARRRGLAALGLLGVAAPTAAAAAPAAGLGAGAGSAALGVTPVVLKWTLVVSLGSAALGGAALLGRVTSDAPRAGASAAPMSVVSAARPNADTTADEPSAAVPSAPAASPDRERPTPSGRLRAESAPHVTRAASLRDEIDRLDRARGALARRAPDAALAALADYATHHPRGELREEAAVLRIEALRAKGDEPAAAAAAERFDERFPDSAHQDRVHESAR